MDKPIINKVAQSGLLTINLEKEIPKMTIKHFDLTAFLFQGLILKEQDFRQQLKELDWRDYQDELVMITCTTDVIIPQWAYMLVATYLRPVARDSYWGLEEEQLQLQLLINWIRTKDWSLFADERVIIKGCGTIPFAELLYFEITKCLHPIVKSIMYGEPCSTVPVYKKKTS